MYRLFAIVILAVAIVGGNSCRPSNSFTIADSLFLILPVSDYYYDLKKPADKHFLPYVLSEISGLTYTPDDRLICVEDEGGRVYFYNPATREIDHSIRFWGPGDFEGVELVDEQIFVLESNGDLFKFPLTEEKEVVATRIETELRRGNNTEGFGYDAETNSLLIACKDEPNLKDTDHEPRTVYSYDLSSGELGTQARFMITKESLKKFYETHRDFDYEMERIKFKPSGIAYHPLDKTFYVLASVGKLLVNVNAEGEIIGTYPIQARVLSQPEGICFAPNGDMYISSEGEGDRGYILKFPMVKRKR